jgi:hypothetical protein
MIKRLAAICFMAMFLLAVSSPSGQAQTPSVLTLKGISALSVLVEELPDSAKALGLTSDTLQTDVELKLRLAGESEELPHACGGYSAS